MVIPNLTWYTLENIGKHIFFASNWPADFRSESGCVFLGERVGRPTKNILQETFYPEDPDLSYGNTRLFQWHPSGPSKHSPNGIPTIL